MQFAHDFQPPNGDPERLESDFCEMTFALVRMSVIAKIGFLDEDYKFYHEDGDFGLRLRQAGHSAAYLPKSQIEHFAGSTFARKDIRGAKIRYLKNSKDAFSRKHLGYRVKHVDHKSRDGTSWNAINRNLHPYLRRYGLIDDAAPEIIFSHPGTEPFDYLYTVWETTKLPVDWLRYKHAYKGLFVASRWNIEIFERSGFQNVCYAPLGVETDIFQPWGPKLRPYEGKTYLWLAHNQYRKALEVALKAWVRFHGSQPDAHLVVTGHGVLRAFPGKADRTRRWKNFLISDYIAEGISVYEILSPVDDETLAALYRSVDFTVSSSRSEGFGLTVAESMACGTPAIFANYGATREFGFDGALLLDGTPTAANYSDKGFGDVGDWWEPDVDHLVALLHKSYALDAPSRRRLSREGMRIIRNRFTWRTSVLALRSGIAARQEASKTRVKPVAGARTAAESGRAKLFAKTLKRFAGNWLRLTSPPMAARSGVLFVGYAEAGLGLAESFRATLSAAADRQVAFGIYPFKIGVETQIIGQFMPEKYDFEHRYEISVIEVAADQVPTVFNALGRRQLATSYNVLRTYWELPKAPREWGPMLSGINEIWAPNEFVRDAFKEIFSGPITIIPPCVAIDDHDDPGRAVFGLDDRRFYFLVAFDYYSSPQRKNPLGAVHAFRRAFPDLNENVGLIIKSTGAKHHYPEVKEKIRAAIEMDPRISVIDRTMPRREILGLIRACDCFVSLHRGEGFGLGMVEAMSFGNVVIGTDYSGSKDFLSAETGFPVSYELRSVEPDEYVWAKGQVWAEPDMDSAVAALRLVFSDADARMRRSAAGKKLVKRKYGKAAVGALIEKRIREIRLTRASPCK